MNEYTDSYYSTTLRFEADILIYDRINATGVANKANELLQLVCVQFLAVEKSRYKHTESRSWPLSLQERKKTQRKLRKDGAVITSPAGTVCDDH